jgi:HNH endonuclease
MKESKIYRKIWIMENGPIPVDTNGRTYEIHHIDGNRENNEITNLQCVSIEEHYKIHYDNGDYGACVLIAKRMNLPPDHLSSIQKGIKRPGIGGVKKGTIPWNKGKSGYTLNISEQGKLKKLESNISTRKVKQHDIIQILENYNNQIEISDERIGKIQKNGKIFTYKRAFAEHFAKQFNVTSNCIIRILNNHNV